MLGPPAQPQEELDQVIHLVGSEGGSPVARRRRFSAVHQDRFFDRAGPTVVEVRPHRGQAPQGLGTELRAGGNALDQSVGEICAHVVEEQVRVDGEWASRALDAGGVARAAPDVIEDRGAAHPLLPGRLDLGSRQQHRKADEIEQVLTAQLGVRDTVPVGQRPVGGSRLDERLDRGRGGGRLCRAIHRKGCLLGVGERLGRDPQVVEQRAADEPLDRHRLRLAPETAHETAIEVRPAADPITVFVVGVGPGQDLFPGDLGEQAHAEERDRVSLRHDVHVAGDHGPRRVVGRVGVNADDTAGLPF